VNFVKIGWFGSLIYRGARLNHPEIADFTKTGCFSGFKKDR